MEYQALYRKYRPQDFNDVIGQDHVTATLSREVAEGRVAHAYLFAGPRGTGKTSTARILAKALNCENRLANGSPDNVCRNCEAITEGSSLDVLELDAASHNSVDDIRDMRISVSTVASSAAGRRIFILDEAHMLSKAAGNALLKTLEEPPEHVHFVLATTEPYKLLDTIRSRSQRFDFHPVSLEVIAAHLRRVSEHETYRFDPPALMAVARHALGSVRDALSLLEQVAALGNGTVDIAGVNRALGLADREVYNRLALAMSSQDGRAALELVAQVSSQGVDLRRFVAEAIAFLRGVFLAHYAPNLAEIADEPQEILDDWRRAAKELSAGEVLRGVDVLGDALVKLREGREERLMVELALLKLARPEFALDAESLSTRLDRVEERLTRITTSPPSTLSPAPSPAAEPLHEPSPDTSLKAKPRRRAPAVEAGSPAIGPPQSAPEVTKPAPVEGLTLEQVQTVWPALLSGARQALGARRGALLREAIPVGVAGNKVTFSVPHEFHLEALKQDQVVAAVVGAKAADLLGGAVRIDFRAAGPVPVVEEQVELDKDRLFEAPEDVTDPVALLKNEFGAELVEEVAES